MASISIDDEYENITEITWATNEGVESISLPVGDAIRIKDSNADNVYIWTEDIPKLIKALQKAKELGWWSE